MNRATRFPGGVCKRVDSLGHFVFKYSDDHGRTWSAQRYADPDPRDGHRPQESFGGKLPLLLERRPAVHPRRRGVTCRCTRSAAIGEGFFTRSEGVLLKSANILTERDPAKITWETLPDGDFGLRTPPGGGPSPRSRATSSLSDGSLYCVYRTIDGHPACAYSRDGGHTWTAARVQTLSPTAGRMKHPRAANFVLEVLERQDTSTGSTTTAGRFIGEHPGSGARIGLRRPQPGLALRRGARPTRPRAR